MYFTLFPLVTMKKVTSESTLQLILYQMDKLCKGDEWVTSEVKWITATTLWHRKLYGAMGDELQSYVKNLFFEVDSILPLLQVPSKSQVNPL